MTSWKNRLRRMLFLHKLEPLVIQTPKVAELGSNSERLDVTRLSHSKPACPSSVF